MRCNGSWPFSLRAGKTYLPCCTSRCHCWHVGEWRPSKFRPCRRPSSWEYSKPQLPHFAFASWALRQDTGTTAQTPVRRRKPWGYKPSEGRQRFFSPNLQLSTKIPHSWTFFWNLKVETPALNRTHDRPMFERGYALPHSTALTKTSSHLTSSCPHSCPALRPEVIDFFPHSSALNRTQPALMANFTKKLAYQETAHLRVGTSLDPLDDPSASPHRLWRSWRQRCQSFRKRHAALRHQRNSLRRFCRVERCQANVESVLRAFTYCWPKKSDCRRWLHCSRLCCGTVSQRNLTRPQLHAGIFGPLRSASDATPFPMQRKETKAAKHMLFSSIFISLQ